MKPESKGEALLSWLKQQQANQPKLSAEAAALWRQGREDFLNTLMGMSLMREAGTPGNPTQQILTSDLLDKDVDKETDRVSVLGYVLPPQEPQKEAQQEKQRGM